MVWVRTSVKNAAALGREAGGDVLLHVGEHGILIGRRELGERRAFLRLRVDVDRGEVGGIAGARACAAAR